MRVKFADTAQSHQLEVVHFFPSRLVRNNVHIKTVPKLVKLLMKAMFVSHFAPEVEESDIVTYINQELIVSELKVSKLKTKYHTYSSFYVAVANSDRIFNTVFWLAGSLISPFYSCLLSE
ncbi:hypothetical protein PR048_011522 [Dryococelus australis]|uniref:Uncharacterized protein n=1 Tax=Dryococelus australis TaxID=614101 RepID=A0ABQ9HMB4_9NEOP|nr:hypothetical protein PR048_011522 [Dryococelus australis]